MLILFKLTDCLYILPISNKNAIYKTACVKLGFFLLKKWIFYIVLLNVTLNNLMQKKYQLKAKMITLHFMRISIFRILYI